jgi:hypothetical protein
MVGLYLKLLFDVCFANAVVGVAGISLLVVLGFCPFDRSWMNGFFHSLNRVLHIF